MFKYKYEGMTSEKESYMSTIEANKSQEKGSFHYKYNDRNYPPPFKLENLNQNSTNVTLTERQNTLE
jgi:hypothetical protein